MNSRPRQAVIGALSLLLLVYSGIVTAQLLHRSGQGVQPVFEGFEQLEDGSYALWFGYLNRNHEETPNIPVGQNNFFRVADGVSATGPIGEDLLTELAGPGDRGQPAFFYPRRQQFVFAVQVPGDFAGRELIWTLIHHGETLTAVASLAKENVWNIDEGVWSANRGRGIMGRTEVDAGNSPPSIRAVGVEGQLNTVLGQPVTLRVFASDDGEPGAYRGRRRVLEPLPNALPEVGGRVGDNSPKTQSIVNFTAADETGLAVTWIKYRGPGQVHFDPMVSSLEPIGGEIATSATFTESGRYILRAYADDGNFTRSTEVTVVVQ